jgi:hypothetical protein
MGRRTALLVIGVLMVLAAGAADAQTTSTTSTTSTSTSTSTSTTSTTLVNPCAGQPCTTQPPVAVLSGSAGELTLGTGGYCWRQPDGMTGVCVTAALAPEESRPTLVVRAGETLTLRFGTAMAPTSVMLNRGGDASLQLAATNPTTFRVDLAPGIFNGAFLAQWLQGDATYSVRLDVRAASRPDAQDPRPLSLTG